MCIAPYWGCLIKQLYMYFKAPCPTAFNFLRFKTESPPSHGSQFSRKQMIPSSYIVEWVRSRYISQEQVLIRKASMKLVHRLCKWSGKGRMPLKLLIRETLLQCISEWRIQFEIFACGKQGIKMHPSYLFLSTAIFLCDAQHLKMWRYIWKCKSISQELKEAKKPWQHSRVCTSPSKLTHYEVKEVPIILNHPISIIKG